MNNVDDTRFLHNGCQVHVSDSSICCFFPQPKLVLSTSQYNGGFIVADGVFNHRLTMFVETERDLPGGSQAGYLEQVAGSLGFEADRATGLLTTARMSSMALSREQCRHLIVEAVTTAGVEVNAARAGEPASYYEEEDRYHPVGGTINTIVFVNARMNCGAMAKALVTVTEAKTAALQELNILSKGGFYPATGTGTDGAIIVTELIAPSLSDAGTHSKLGEMIANAVSQSVKQSLRLECEMTSHTQGSLERRIRDLRFDSEIEDELLGQLASLTKQQRDLLMIRLISVKNILLEHSWGLVPPSCLATAVKIFKDDERLPFRNVLARLLTARVKSAVDDEATEVAEAAYSRIVSGDKKNS